MTVSLPGFDRSGFACVPARGRGSPRPNGMGCRRLRSPLPNGSVVPRVCECALLSQRSSCVGVGVGDGGVEVLALWAATTLSPVPLRAADAEGTKWRQCLLSELPPSFLPCAGGSPSSKVRQVRGLWAPRCLCFCVLFWLLACSELVVPMRRLAGSMSRRPSVVSLAMAGGSLHFSASQVVTGRIAVFLPSRRDGRCFAVTMSR